MENNKEPKELDYDALEERLQEEFRNAVNELPCPASIKRILVKVAANINGRQLFAALKFDENITVKELMECMRRGVKKHTRDLKGCDDETYPKEN